MGYIMNNITKHTLENVIKAFEGTGGIIARVAEKLNVTNQTVFNYMNRWPELDEVRQKERSSMFTNLENVVYTSALNGKTEDAKWLLSKLDRANFGDKTDVNIISSGNVQSLSDVIGSVTDEERAALRAKFFERPDKEEIPIIGRGR
jgi:hypothetical protein